VRAVERDTDEVRRAALAGLVRCRDGRARDLLLRILERRAESAALRGLAAQLLGRLGARDAAPALATAVASLLQESQADLAIEATLALTLGALVSLDSRLALSAALLVLADPRPAPKRAAVEALGRLCDKDAGRAALQKLASGDDEALAVTASAALRRCDR
jgi:hypothetical protein